MCVSTQFRFDFVLHFSFHDNPKSSAKLKKEKKKHKKRKETNIKTSPNLLVIHSAISWQKKVKFQHIWILSSLQLFNYIFFFYIKFYSLSVLIN